MDLQANVKLSKEEWELVQNTEWILTKHAIIQKVISMFGQLSEEFRNVIQDAAITEFISPEPKISKGEQYEKLPYVMLDFPRVFDKENVFAVRSFFWWGNFFSINLHVSGKYKERFFSSEKKLEQFKSWSFCISEDPWRHDFSVNNFLPFAEVNIKEQLQRPFIKIAKKIPLSEWNNVYDFYRNNFGELFRNLVS